MKISRHVLNINKTYNYEEDIDFSNAKLPSNILRVSSCDTKAEVTDYGDILRIKVKINAQIVTTCAYSLEEVEIPICCEDELDFSNNEEDQSECLYEPNVTIDLDPYLLGIISCEIPVRVVKKGKRLPENGKGYRVISESDLVKEREKKSDDRWSKLDDIELE